jgi:hypothetical protein
MNRWNVNLSLSKGDSGMRLSRFDKLSMTGDGFMRESRKNLHRALPGRLPASLEGGGAPLVGEQFVEFFPDTRQV